MLSILLLSVSSLNYPVHRLPSRTERLAVTLLIFCESAIVLRFVIWYRTKLITQQFLIVFFWLVTVKRSSGTYDFLKTNFLKILLWTVQWVGLISETLAVARRWKTFGFDWNSAHLFLLLSRTTISNQKIYTPPCLAIVKNILISVHHRYHVNYNFYSVSPRHRFILWPASFI